MVTAQGTVRPIASGPAGGVFACAAATPAAGWPPALIPAQTAFRNPIYSQLSGEDEQAPRTGLWACRQLDTGQPTSAVIGATAAHHGCGR